MDHPSRSPGTSPSYRKSQASNDIRRKFPVIARPSRKNEQHARVSIQMRAGMLSIRDATSSDADAYVHYWHFSGEGIKNLLGIDSKKLGAPEDSRKRFLEMIRIPGAEQRNVIFTITLNDKVIGYTNVNRHGLDDNYVHLHTYRSALRSALQMSRSTGNAKTGASLAAVLIGPGMSMYFDLFPVRRLVLPTRPQNRWINDALNLYMPPAETKYFDTPAGLAAPGYYHLRYVRREDVPWMLGRAELLKKARDVRTAVAGLYPLRPEAAEGSRLPLGPAMANTVPAETALAAR